MASATVSFPGSSACLLGLLGVLALGAGLPGRAHAQSAADPQPFEPQVRPVADPVAAPPVVHLAPLVPSPRRSWYGYQIMATDLVSVGLMSTGRTASFSGLTFFGAPPTIHGLHGNVRMAIVSPAMRVGLPLVGMVLGSSAEQCSQRDDGELDFCGLGGAIKGAALGMLTAMVVDYALAWQVTAATPAAVTAAPVSARGAPTVRLSSAGVAPVVGGATLVLGGRF